MQELNFPELDVGDVKLKIKRVRTSCADGLAKVIKSENSGAGLGGGERCAQGSGGET